MTSRRLFVAILAVALLGSMFGARGANASTDVVITANNASVLNLTLSATAITFGAVSPVQNSGGPLFHANLPGNNGTRHCSAPLVATVQSNHAAQWTFAGSANVTSTEPGSSNMNLADVGYATACGGIPAFGPDLSSLPSTTIDTGFATNGDNVVDHVVVLDVNWNDTPGNFAVDIDFTLSV